MAKIFGATSTTDEVLEDVTLRGKRVLVTGVSAGLGVETARALVARGAEVVGAVRDLERLKRRPRACGQPPQRRRRSGARGAQSCVARERARLRRRADC